MKDFTKRLLSCCSTGEYDLDKSYTVNQEVRNLFEKKIKRAKIECYLRLLAGVFITVYGAFGIKYNTGRYVQWALFTALVGFITSITVLLWYWVIQAKLTILREVRQLRFEVNMLSEDKEDSQD